MSTNTHYEPLPSRVYPQAVIEYCSAQSLGEQKIGGARRCRISFADLEDKGDLYRVAVKTGHFCLNRRSYSPFSVLIDGSIQTVQIHKKSLQNRFHLTAEQYETAVANDDLLTMISEQVRNIKKQDATEPNRNNPIKGSASANQLSFELIDIRDDFNVLELPAALVGQGVHPKIDEVQKNAERGLIRRQIIIRSNTNERMMEIMHSVQSFKNHPGVLPYLALCTYQSGSRYKLEIYYPLCEKNLIEQAPNLSERIRLKYAKQLLTILDSLNGSLGNLTMETILIQNGDLFIYDFAFFRSFDDKRPLVWGKSVWSAPEVWREKVPFKEKIDSWSVGMILCKLFSSPHPSLFPWEAKKSKHKSPDFYTQESIDEHLRNIPFSEAQRDLVMQLLQYDPDKRLSIQQALEWVTKRMEE